MKRTVLLSAALWLILTPVLRADVIPAAPQAGPKPALEQTLVERGIAAPEARSMASAASSEDAAWFEDNPERVQAVGGLLFEEWMGAAIAVVGIPLATYILLRGVDIFGD